MERVLIVDDEEPICRLCAYGLERIDLQTEWTTSAKEALDKVTNEQYDLLITDIKMPGMTGIELMHEAHKVNPEIGVLVMTAYATIEIAIDALNEGANNFIHKPFHLDELKFTVRNILDNLKLFRENVRLKSLVNLIDVTEKINTVYDPKRLYSIVMDAALKETGATRGKIYKIGDESRELTLVSEVLSDNRSDNFEANFALSGNDVFEVADVEVETDDESSEALVVPAAIAIPLRANNKLKGILSLFNDNGNAFSSTDLDVANLLGTQAAIALENVALINEVEELFLETIKSLATTLDEKDPYTHGHSQRVATIARAIGERMGLDHKSLEILSLAGSLHDIGKIGIPDTILQKPGRLTDDEYEIIKTHPEKGAKILGNIKRLEPIVEAVYSHHEWYNGDGYPRGLAREEIPLCGAIICVADALDSITTDRTYRKRRSVNEAYQIIAGSAGTQFHPDVVEAALVEPIDRLFVPKPD
ncbi:MAG: HD domain-containing phosphohydrolase [bacterium]